MHIYLAGIVIKEDKLILHFAGCDFKCPYCFAGNMLEFKNEFKIDDIRDVKKELSKHNATKIIFSGGEPCLQRAALIDLLKYCKSLGLKTYLDTNGSKPDTLKLLIDAKLLNGICFDIKAPFETKIFEKTTRSSTFFMESSTIIKELQYTLEVLKDKDIEIDIKTTIVPGVIFKKEDILAIANEIKDLDCRWILQQFTKDERDYVDSRFSSIEPPSKKFLENIRDFVQKEFPTLRIEVNAD